MNARRWIGTALLMALVALVGASTATAGQRWLHVRVESAGDDKVNINVPLDLVETLLPMIDADELHEGKVRVDDDDLEGLDLREIADALRDMSDTTFVTMRSRDESVRVAKEGEFLIVRVEDEGRYDTEHVRVRIPLAVFSALVTDDPHELDLMAAFRALREFDGEDLVRVESDDELVRIWIDSSEDGS